MAFPGDVNSLGSVSGSQTLAAAGHATRHNEVKTALEGLRDVLGGTAVPSGTVQPILAAGSASAPSLSFTGDSNTGLWSPAADTVAASTGGTERMRIDSSGNVGIGTSNPNSRIHINAPASTDSLITITGWGFSSFIGNKSGHTTITNSAGDISFIPAYSERMRIDSAGLITGTGTSLGAWTAYTPTLGGTGWAIGNGTVTGRYCQIGKIVHFYAEITFGSTSTFGAGALTVTIPTTAASSGVSLNVHSSFQDASASLLYMGNGTIASAGTTVTPRGLASATGELASVIDTKPFTWATSDTVRVSGTYETA